MIDAVDLPFVEHPGNRVVDGARAVQIAADRLLDDQPGHGIARAVDEPRAVQLLHRGNEQRRRQREVVDAVAGEAALVLDDVEPCAERRQALLAVERRVDEKQHRGKRLPRLPVDRPAGKLRDAVLREFPVGRV